MSRTISMAEARRYVYSVLATTLENDLLNGDWPLQHPDDREELSEDDVTARRIERAATKILHGLRKRSGP